MLIVRIIIIKLYVYVSFMLVSCYYIQIIFGNRIIILSRPFIALRIVKKKEKKVTLFFLIVL